MTQNELHQSWIRFSNINKQLWVIFVALLYFFVRQMEGEFLSWGGYFSASQGNLCFIHFHLYYYFSFLRFCWLDFLSRVNSKLRKSTWTCFFPEFWRLSQKSSSQQNRRSTQWTLFTFQKVCFMGNTGNFSSVPSLTLILVCFWE